MLVPTPRWHTSKAVQVSMQAWCEGILLRIWRCVGDTALGQQRITWCNLSIWLCSQSDPAIWTFSKCIAPFLHCGSVFSLAQKLIVLSTLHAAWCFLATLECEYGSLGSRSLYRFLAKIVNQVSALKQIRRIGHPRSWRLLRFEKLNPQLWFWIVFQPKDSPLLQHAATSLHWQQWQQFVLSLHGGWSHMTESKCYHTGWDLYFEALCARKWVQQPWTF